MNTPPISELNARARDIFRLVVEGYLASGQPVGSKTLAGTSGVNLSPASIRSVLQDLQDAGLLAAPHTSAGRLPTDQGLRLFVDGIMQVAAASEAVRDFGIKYGLNAFTTRQIEANEADAWQFVALAGMLTNAVGAYRCPGAATVYVTLYEID